MHAFRFLRESAYDQWPSDVTGSPIIVKSTRNEKMQVHFGVAPLCKFISPKCCFPVFTPSEQGS